MNDEELPSLSFDRQKLTTDLWNKYRAYVEDYDVQGDVTPMSFTQWLIMMVSTLKKDTEISREEYGKLQLEHERLKTTMNRWKKISQSNARDAAMWRREQWSR